jgi:hypothetical protein
VDARAHGERRHRCEQDSVAVGCSARGGLGRDDGAAAGTIVDHHRPLELVLQLVREEARENVGATAGRKRTQEGHRTLRIILSRRLRQSRAEHIQGERERRSEHHSLSHVSPLAASVPIPKFAHPCGDL